MFLALYNVISLLLRGTDMDSENLSLISLSVSDGMKGCIIDRYIIKHIILTETRLLCVDTR